MTSIPQLNKRNFNFAAGPSALAEEVLQRCSEAIISVIDTNESILELSHRSKAFQSMIAGASNLLRELLNVPSTHQILFMQGGGTGQFAASALNVLAHRNSEQCTADYLVTGTWSKAALLEAQRLNIDVNIVCDGAAEFGNFIGVPSKETWKFTPASKAAYVYYCANETVNGVEVFDVPEVDPSVPLICDMSSNILARPIDVSKFAVIFAGAQKNLGPAGVTVAIVREDILERHSSVVVPTAMDYVIMAKNGSLYNTPPTFSILALKYNLEWVVKKGGLEAMVSRAKSNSTLLYNAIDNSENFYVCPVKDIASRSLTNIVFNLATPELEDAFVVQAASSGLINLKGHRSVGGIRASLYNGVPDQATEALIAFMAEFKNANSN